MAKHACDTSGFRRTKGRTTRRGVSPHVDTTRVSPRRGTRRIRASARDLDGLLTAGAGAGGMALCVHVVVVCTQCCGLWDEGHTRARGRWRPSHRHRPPHPHRSRRPAMVSMIHSDAARAPGPRSWARVSAPGRRGPRRRGGRPGPAGVGRISGPLSSCRDPQPTLNRSCRSDRVARD